MTQLTALADAHQRAGARMVTFAGWQLPVQYASALDEHRAVRNTAGMFDVSHMMITDITGAGAGDWLRALLCSDVASLTAPGAGRYTCALNDQGGVIDDLIVFRRADQDGVGAYRIVSNAGTRERIEGWFAQRRSAWSGAPLTLTKRDDLSMLAVQGPHAMLRAAPVLAAAVGSGDAEPLASLARFHAHEEGEAFVSRTGYTGEDGFEVCLPHAMVGDLWQRLQQEASVVPCGLAARDVLRLEAGLNLHGSDMDEQTRPQEAGLRWLIDLKDEQRNFVGRDAVDPATAQAPRFLRRGLRLEEKGVPRAGCEVLAGADAGSAAPVGAVTSGTFSNSLGVGVALWRLQGDARDQLESAEQLFVQIRQRRVRATLSPPPFVSAGGSAS